MKKTTKIAIGVGAGIVILVTGITLYIRNKRRKALPVNISNESIEETNAVDEKVSDDFNKLEPKPVTSQTPSVQMNVGSQPMAMPVLINSVEKIKLFQDWLDKTHPTWLNGGKLLKRNGYGQYGPATKNAWSLYGNEYTSFVQNGMNVYTSTNNQTVPVMTNLELVKSRLKDYAGNYNKGVDGIYYVDVYLNNFSYVFRFYSNNRFAFSKVNSGSLQLIQGGTYRDAGRVLVVDKGTKKGQTIKTSNFWDSLNALKA